MLHHTVFLHCHGCVISWNKCCCTEKVLFHGLARYMMGSPFCRFSIVACGSTGHAYSLLPNRCWGSIFPGLESINEYVAHVLSTRSRNATRTRYARMCRHPLASTLPSVPLVCPWIAALLRLSLPRERFVRSVDNLWSRLDQASPEQWAPKS